MSDEIACLQWVYIIVLEADVRLYWKAIKDFLKMKNMNLLLEKSSSIVNMLYMWNVESKGLEEQFKKNVAQKGTWLNK